MSKEIENKIEEKLEWGKLATFIPNKKIPVYNWFYFKEGFSRDLVFKIFNMFDLNSENLILDPFCGSGTTLLACKEYNINSIGYDVLPIAIFSSRVKINDYDINELKRAAKFLLKQKFQRPLIPKIPSIIHRAFSKYALDDIFFFREKINKLDNSRNRNFFLLALINSAILVSYAWKDGSVIKIKKRRTAPFKIMFRRVIYKMIKDLENFKIINPSAICKTVVENCDARRLNLYDECIDAVITSPPYLNQIDYTKVYVIENFFIGRPEPAVRSYIGLKSEDEADLDINLDIKLPPQATAYFNDITLCLKEMYRVCKAGAKIAIVVGNAYFPDQIVESDIILSELAEKIGFNLKRIFVLNKRFALVRRTKKRGILRESLIVLEK